jgi:hypothetical protein
MQMEAPLLGAPISELAIPKSAKRPTRCLAISVSEFGLGEWLKKPRLELLD